MRTLRLICLFVFSATVGVFSTAVLAQANPGSSAPVTAAPANDELSQAIREYLKLTNAETQHASVIAVMNDTVVRAARASLGESLKAKPMQANKQQDANLVMGKNFGDFAENSRKTLMTKYPWSKMVDDIYLPAYKKQFSLVDMKTAIEFFRSPVGRKVVELNPKIVEDAIKTMGEKYSPQLSKEFGPQVEELVKKIRTEFDKLEK
jgi:hypothetical protein